MTELEAVAALGWQGTSTARLGQWLLRAGGGFTGRANSVLPLGSAGCAIDEALTAVTKFYSGHGLLGIFQLPQDHPGSALDLLDEELGRRGWPVFNTAVMMTASLATVLANCPLAPNLVANFQPQPSAEWLATYHYRGRPLPPSAIEVLLAGAAPVFVTVGDGDRLGVARGVVTQGWLSVTAVTVDHRHRRTGIGRQLMGELAGWAAAQAAPAHSVYLQVDAENSVALTMYDRLGFTPHHRYHYRRQPSVPS